MDKENYEFLTEKLKYSGFEDQLNAALKKEIQSGKEEFTLPHQIKLEGKQMDMDLSFKKSQISDRYFFNKFEAKLQNPETGQEPKTHTFYQNQGITVKEAFNLLEGRAVEKSLLGADKEPFKAWLQLDLSKKDEKNNFPINQFHEKYGYDLKEALQKFPIKELQDETKMDWMLKSLKKGNTYPVVMERKGMEEIMFVEANPKFKSINVYDVNMNSVKNSEILGAKQTVSPDQKECLGTDKKKELNKQEKTSKSVASDEMPGQKAARPRKSRGRAI
ncbi:hypothetical protein [uncultured Algoriphagus sp.]|uniref:hypothetical protein n=1 Tax=uncultured Algoriphagus sp. TaxID=417365 RepID=UPI00258D2608|nr:hypothetical protein [uncultured Algoriphagus sp.]